MSFFKLSLATCAFLVSQNLMSQNLPQEITKFTGIFRAECTTLNKKINFVNLYYHQDDDVLLLRYAQDEKFFEGTLAMDYVSKKSFSERTKFKYGGRKTKAYSTIIGENTLTYNMDSRQSSGQQSSNDYTEALQIKIWSPDVSTIGFMEASGAKTTCTLTRK